MGHNPHHWEYWIDFANDGSIIANKIPIKYVIEMVCDWIGAGKVYSKEKWTEEEPYNYYLKVRAGRHFHKDTETLLKYYLQTIKNNGLMTFYYYAKDDIRASKQLGQYFYGPSVKWLVDSYDKE